MSRNTTSQTAILKEEEEDCQLCDRITKSNPRYNTMVKLVEQQGCTTENNNLTLCLKQNRNMWSRCREATQVLAECVRRSKQQDP